MSDRPEHIVSEVMPPAAPGAQLVEELAALRDKNRLAVHMNEKGATSFSSITWNWFQTPPDKFAQLVGQGKERYQQLPVVSMSLLPALGQAVRPYGAGDLPYSLNYSYLIDLSQDRADRAMPFGFFTGGRPSDFQERNKVFWRYTKDFMPFDLNERFAGDNDGSAWCQAIAGDEGPQLCTRMLEAMAGHLKAKNEMVSSFNEVISPVHYGHIKAIAIPILAEHYAQSLPCLTLMGAVAGLDHLSRGIDFPVVLYQLGNLPTAPSGNITYIGRGRAELLKVALDVIKGCQGDACHNISQKLSAKTKEVLGIDTSQPLADQKSAVEKIEKKIAEAQAHVR